MSRFLAMILTVMGLLLAGGGLAFHFAALEIFNALVPKDAGSRVVAQDVAYGADARQRLDVYAPAQGQGPWPVVVFVHGGSWQEGSKHPYAFAGRALASQGFVTMVISYRLHPEGRYPAFIEDTALAITWASRHAADYGGDASELFAMGHSAGAYNLAMAVLDAKYAVDRPLLKGVVTLAGPFDFLPLDSPITKAVFGAVPDLPSTQPVNVVAPEAPPFLLLHGTADKTVFPRNATALDKALRQAGAESTLKFYDNVTHVDIVLSLSTWLRGRSPALADAVTFMKDKSR